MVLATLKAMAECFAILLVILTKIYAGFLLS